MSLSLIQRSPKLRTALENYRRALAHARVADVENIGERVNAARTELARAELAALEAIAVGYPADAPVLQLCAFNPRRLVTIGRPSTFKLEDVAAAVLDAEGDDGDR